MEYSCGPKTDAQERLRALFEYGVRFGAWSTMANCAQKLTMPPRTLNHHLNDNSTEGPVLQTIDKVMKYLHENGFFGSLPEVPKAKPPPKKAPPLVLDSNRIDKLVAGLAEIEGQVSNDGTRFVVTVKTVCELCGVKFTPAELEDTEELLNIATIALEELSRRLGLFLQLPTDKHRYEIWKRLQRRIDAFYAATVALRKDGPTGAAEMLEAVEKRTSKLRQLKQGK